MTDLPRVNQWLSRVTYMPGWKLFAREDEWQGIYVRIVAPVTDAYTGEPTVLGINTPVPPMVLEKEQEFYSWLLWRLRRGAIHEVLEFYRVDGKPWRDPHEEDV